MLFLDDDIARADGACTLDRAGLERAIAATRADPSLSAVGWTLEDFDDNSVVGHARRLAGLPQQIFIGGGALLLRCDEQTPFFPEIYNEDWLFLIALMLNNRSLGWAGRVRQVPYDPFVVRRACSEEAGDILGEALMNLWEDDGPGMWATAASPAFWRQSLMARRTVVERTAALLANVGDDRADRARRAGRSVPGACGHQAGSFAVLRVRLAARPQGLGRVCQVTPIRPAGRSRAG